jgi:hypothetical protein
MVKHSYVFKSNLVIQGPTHDLDDLIGVCLFGIIVILLSLMREYRMAYCSRCERTFSSTQARQQHHNDSASHNQCEVCGFDGSTWDELLRHHRKTQHRIVCQGCDDGDGAIWVPGSQEYIDHLAEHNVCKTCDGHFESPSNLDHVSWVDNLSIAPEPTLTRMLASHRPFETVDRMLWLLPNIQYLCWDDNTFRIRYMRI